MDELSDYQRYLLHQLSKPSTSLEATKMNGAWVFAMNNVAVDEADVRPLAKEGLIEGKPEGAWVVYRLTEKGHGWVVANRQ